MPTNSIAFEGHVPRVDPEAWVAPNATLVGQVWLRGASSVFYGSVLRADGDSITVGLGSNVQDGCLMHADPGFPVTIGENVSVGHGAVLHGCTVGDDCLIGMGAIVLNGARVGAGALIAAGTVVPEDAVIPERSLVAGVPARVRRELSNEQTQAIRENAATYRDLARLHRKAAGHGVEGPLPADR